MLALAASAQALRLGPLSPAGLAEAPWKAEIEHVLDLSSIAATGSGVSKGDGQAPRELSALAWDPQARELVTASDRGRLFRYRVTVKDGRLNLDALPVRRITIDAPASAGRPARINAEALAWRSLSVESVSSTTVPAGPPRQPQAVPQAADQRQEPHGELLLAGEQADRVWRLGPEGRSRGALDWPAAVRTALSARADDGSRHGVEALTWHVRHGLLAALQRPVKAVPEAGRPGARHERLHWVHASSGARWGFAVAGADSQLKAIEARPDGTLLLLERVRQPGGKRLHTVLRWLDPAGCGDTALCAAPPLPVEPAPIVGDDNVEGLACTADGTCWLVNDGGAKGEQPTRLWQFRLVPR